MINCNQKRRLKGMADKKVVVDFEKKITVELSPEEYVNLQKLLRRRWYQRGWFWGVMIIFTFGMFAGDLQKHQRRFCYLTTLVNQSVNFPHCLLVRP
jgi:hypothetical protein